MHTKAAFSLSLASSSLSRSHVFAHSTQRPPKSECSFAYGSYTLRSRQARSTPTGKIHLQVPANSQLRQGKNLSCLSFQSLFSSSMQ